MILSNIKIGVVLTGSFCTFETVLKNLKSLTDKGYDLYPIMSFNAFGTDTRFGKAEDIRAKLLEITKKENIINSIVDAEPIGPKAMFDVLIVTPCTSNTMAKIVSGVIDTPATMAVKSHLRNGSPVIIGMATNDALGASAKNIGMLLTTNNMFFVPFRQDDFGSKPRSMVANFDLLEETIKEALTGRQIQPIIY